MPFRLALSGPVLTRRISRLLSEFWSDSPIPRWGFAKARILPVRQPSQSWWEFRPEKKYLAPPPPKSPQTPSRPLAPPTRPGDTPSWDFQQIIVPLPSRRLGLPPPLPHTEKKNPKRPPSNKLRPLAMPSWTALQ